jgi:uncharacterized protein
MSYEKLFHEFMSGVCAAHPDPTHDILHVERVVAVAKKLAHEEGAKLEVVVPAAYLHDCVYIAKTDSRRAHASTISADRALELLKDWGYDKSLFPAIHHAIRCHSFSANIAPETLEAKIVQDADRLDAIGAIGVVRAFWYSGLIRRRFYNPEDPFCKTRVSDDYDNTLDHFSVKLLKLQDQLHTPAAKSIGARRMQTMHSFLEALRSEIEN